MVNYMYFAKGRETRKISIGLKKIEKCLVYTIQYTAVTLGHFDKICSSYCA